jgi:hypothetical protein
MISTQRRAVVPLEHDDHLGRLAAFASTFGLRFALGDFFDRLALLADSASFGTLRCARNGRRPHRPYWLSCHRPYSNQMLAAEDRQGHPADLLSGSILQ